MTVRLAMIGQFSGDAVPEGLSARNCVRLAVAQRHARSGSTSQFGIAKFDNVCDPATGPGVVREAGADGTMVAAVAHYCSTVGLATMHEFHAHRLPAVFWGTIHPDITHANAYLEFHRVNGAWANQEDATATFFTRLGYRRWAFIHDGSFHGRTHSKFFPRYLAEAGGTIAATFEVAVERCSLKAEMARVTALDPDVVYAAAAFDAPLQPYGAFAYAAAQFIMDAAERVGASRSLVCRFLNGVIDHPTVLGPVTFDAQGRNRNPPVTFWAVQDARCVTRAKSRRGRGTIPPAHSPCG